jgi:hypothetical protein
VPKKLKKQEFHLTSKLIFRFVIFCFLVYLAINYLSNSSTNINIKLPNVYQYLPPQSQHIIDQNISRLQGFPYSEKLNQAISYCQEFPEKHLRQLKIDIINSIAKELVSRINK